MTSDDRSLREKRLLHASRYRGSLESDLFFGRFAEHHLSDLDDEQLDRYEALLREADVDLMNWLYGRRPVPPEHDNDVFALLKSFDFAATNA